ncbi:proteasome PCI domain-containing protein, putative [Eimeria necatrix]|uniref:Proteasome PCI domain-containing protein, putative n=1 Tax=Eimeria necatrix TaxID=51315 RepID=U6MPP3_9EIME|nr:proteasome PCI domain-containing protein, putative [Eimeria necatrix]CDJ66182.1 proteasome PCI domain-containing protein, putative [Eimeria necatrix]
MTTFVPLAADTDGTASAVAVGEWLLHLITLYDSEDTQRTKDYYREFMSCFTRDEAAGETKITNPINLLSLLLSQNELVFRWLGEIRSAQDAQGQPPAGAETRPELKKSYGDALREVQDFFMLLMSLVVLRITDVEAAGQMAGNFCAVFRASKDQPEFRLKL